MGWLVCKYLITAAVVVAVSEAAKRSDKLGALIAALPLVTILAMIWLHVEGAAAEKVSNHARYTFWYVLPTLPMFLVLPWLLNHGMTFWPALGLCITGTVLLYFVTMKLLSLAGVQL